MSSYIDTYYRRTLATEESYAPAEGTLKTDICIVGGGLAGLTAALDLARAGRSVLLLEAQRVAWGASGRNGGFVSPGYATSLAAIERQTGREQADELYRLTMEGVEIVRGNIDSLAITEAAPSPGIMKVVRYDGGAGLQAVRDTQEKRFGRKLRYLGRDETRALLNSPKYHASLTADDSFHFHPLNYARALAREIVRLGGRIHEGSPVISCELDGAVKQLKTAKATIEADQVLFTTGGYTGDVLPALRRAYIPIATYVLLTEAAPDLIRQAIRIGTGVGDDRRAGDYYRTVEGGSRILWGGRITTRTTEPRDVAAILRHEMVTTYPQLAELKVEAAWSGLMSYARHLMPQIGQFRPGVWYCTAFGGHGMNTTAIGGTVIAEAIRGASDRYKLFAPFGLVWNGGPFGTAAVQLTYWSYQAADLIRGR
ncbi:MULTISPECIES: FAD-binding oxidoreductase [Bosea]|uniref:NAD(P)/FAD-dependent oxidoreductase n=1 Tax=Bosea TaxID=85413 RepID=UPI00214F9A67|nr:MULTISPECIES: FAD-binding oxidoreductase [Bosea]MCR4520513.1 FAD-binding oxidoreductase [Bosea sp. 47.2.35]MDR6827866.1 glycine/D-amino acid oxidase-like deaminating enzyme [Bosea robiniae]MDR6894440.1 glycine/D-amino acid oxidase-like deaminating enzyme [Bosea sp. BE109]MDR7137972.1 glycine/D-amino acid oxidase-like deaminating enzyme [Bosea sp. BE168]MDR7174671.1 glycine/D-amino acid oxidase-like deaminating enzyme [Bosea sp. BE271]